MNEQFYHVQSEEESGFWGDVCDYQTLIGPNNFSCTLTEPEDRTWGRDLQKVTDKLNEYHRILSKLIELYYKDCPSENSLLNQIKIENELSNIIVEARKLTDL